MREELAKLHGLRRRFQGVFERFGTRSGYKGILTTILLRDIMDVASGKVLTEHVWLTMGKRFEKLNLKEGDVVRFDARVTDYLKGYKGRREFDDDDPDFKPVERDFRLSFPTRLIKVEKTGTLG